MLLGRATPEATSRYTVRHAALKQADFFRDARGWKLSSLGLGTYLGDRSSQTDLSYTEAILAAVRGGINFFDTSLNYRDQHSERAIGQAIIKLTGPPKVADRDELIICTKAGYLVRSATPENVEGGDIVGGLHSMAPAFLADQLERSRVNLGLETIDVFYLHNPETQFGFVGEDEFYSRITSAFDFLEQAVAEDKIQFYGAATWEGFRRPHALSVVRMEQIARQVAGPRHHFRFIQLPLNLAMIEASTSRHEQLDGESLSVLQAAARLDITAVASASLLQSKLAKDLPPEVIAAIPGFDTDAQRAIQFARSAPGIAAALVGMGRPRHVEENLEISHRAPLTDARYLDLCRTVV